MEVSTSFNFSTESRTDYTTTETGRFAPPFSDFADANPRDWASPLGSDAPVASYTFSATPGMISAIQASESQYSKNSYQVALGQACTGFVQAALESMMGMPNSWGLMPAEFASQLSTIASLSESSQDAPMPIGVQGFADAFAAIGGIQPDYAGPATGYNTPSEGSLGPGMSSPGSYGPYDGTPGDPDATPAEQGTGPGLNPALTAEGSNYDQGVSQPTVNGFGLNGPVGGFQGEAWVTIPSRIAQPHRPAAALALMVQMSEARQATPPALHPAMDRLQTRQFLRTQRVYAHWG